MLGVHEYPVATVSRPIPVNGQRMPLGAYPADPAFGMMNPQFQRPSFYSPQSQTMPYYPAYQPYMGGMNYAGYRPPSTMLPKSASEQSSGWQQGVSTLTIDISTKEAQLGLITMAKACCVH